jgi:predicted PurR-regulated permease PerM
MLGVLAIRDGVTLQNETLKTINGRASQVQQQIQEAQAKPPAGAKITPQDVEQAMKQIEERSQAMQSNAKGSILKTGANSVGNLVVVGLALIGLGRYGVRPPRN